MITVCMAAFISCGDKDAQDHSADAGEKIDSMVKRARSAIGDAADSIGHGAQHAIQSLKSTQDSGSERDLE